jgi:putative transposase
MPRLLQPLWFILASVTDRKLARMIEYLKEENRILRSRLPKCITVTARERNRLVKLGKRLGSAINELITIVTPRSFARWVVGDRIPKRRRIDRKSGRPRTAEEIRELILQLACETGWGYCRILGELKKLGIRTVSKTTVANILREAGLDPGPKRGEGTWSDFVQRHAATLWACDFLAVRTLTTRGIVELFALVFIHYGSRRAFVAGVTANPDGQWVTQQARNASMQMADWRLPATHLLIDYDSKFPRTFDAVFKAEDIEVKRVGPQAPNLNSVIERFLQSLRRECLDHFVICGECHLRHLLREYVDHHYNRERPHQAKGNVPLQEIDQEAPSILPFPASEVKCRKRLGGLLRHYYRDAA